MRKVGLVLGGGGAKGSYQIGVYQALRDNNLIDDIKMISGTSIGALNLLLLATKDVDKAADIWLSLNKKKVLTVRNIKESLFSGNFSILSRKGMLDIFGDGVDFDKVSKSPIPLYVGVTNLDDDCGEIYQLNNKSKEEIIDYVSASSAIPTVFPNVIINGKHYMDGYLYLNVPIDILESKGCNFLYVVPLSTTLAPKEGDHPNSTIIDFNERQFFDLKLLDGTLNFTKEAAEHRMALGYTNATRLIKYLRKKGVIAVTKKEKIRYAMNKLRGKTKKFKKYYSIDDVDPFLR